MLNSTITNIDFKPENPFVARHSGVCFNAIHSQAFLFEENNMSRFKRTSPPLCGCRCGEVVTKSKLFPYKWNRFIYGHSNRGKYNPNFNSKYIIEKAKSAPLCACGCKNKTKWSDDEKKWNEYIHGHHVRNEGNPKYGQDKYAEEKMKSATFCKCGCKEQAKWSQWNRRWNDYIYGHQTRTKKFFIAPTGKSPLCECGCKESVKWNFYTKRWNRYIDGHDKRSQNFKHKPPDFEAPYCKCGCLKKTKWNKQRNEWRNFLKGHYIRTNSPARKPENRKKISEYMKNGGSAHAASFIRSPSKPQVQLFKKIQKIYPQAILNYPVRIFNRNIDIAIPDLMIAIEYDGSFWHQDKEHDTKRQKELEAIGWIFLRYIDRIPKTDELKKDLKRII